MSILTPEVVSYIERKVSEAPPLNADQLATIRAAFATAYH
jgi:hypothetical protein